MSYAKSSYIIHRKQNIIEPLDKYIKENKNIKEKNLIIISPGGVKGFYSFGTMQYIKEHYDTSNYIYSGASAGAWISLLMCLIDKEISIHDIVTEELKKLTSIRKVEKNIKQTILSKYSNSDFDFSKLFIGITTFHSLGCHTDIYHDFVNLEDAIDCCIASSHIPFITGGLINKYDNKVSFDGGFSKYPYLKGIKPILTVTPSLWSKEKTPLFYENTLFISKEIGDFEKMYKDGYNDAKKNSKILDELLQRKN